MGAAAIPIAIGAQVIGSGFDIWGTIKQADAAKDSAEAQARALRERVKLESQLREDQASEILARQELNAKIARRKIPLLQGEYSTAFSATGRSGGIGALVRIKQEITESLELSRREAEYQANILRKTSRLESRLAEQAAQDIIKGGDAASLGTILGGFGNVATGAAQTALLARGPQ